MKPKRRTPPIPSLPRRRDFADWPAYYATLENHWHATDRDTDLGFQLHLLLPEESLEELRERLPHVFRDDPRHPLNGK